MEKIKLFFENSGTEFSVQDRIPYVNSITVEQAIACQSVRKNPKDHFGIGGSFDKLFEPVTSIPVDQPFYYPIVYSTTTLLDIREEVTIPSEIISCVLKGKAKILIVGPYEGWRPGFYTPLISILNKKYNIKNNNFVIMSANSFPLSCYRTVYLNFWELNAAWKSNDKLIQKGKDILLSNQEKKYKFICLNRRPHGHRFAAITELFDFQDQGLLSFQKITDNGVNPGYYDWQYTKFQKHYPNILQKFLDKEIEKKLPLNLPKELDPYDMLNTNPTNDIYDEKFYQSYLHIVTETFAVDEPEQIFFSEKIFKPMYFFQPFVVIGQSRSLEFLKKAGYKTFSKWINESYDSELHNEKRLQMAVKSAIDFISRNDLKEVMLEMQPILIHNASWIKLRGKMQLHELHHKLRGHLNE